MNSKSLSQLVRRCAGMLLVVTPLAVQADLTYKNVNGTGLIYDSSDNTTWTQDGNFSQSTFTFQEAQTWAASLVVPGVNSNWQLPTEEEFTSLFGQLEAPATINGNPNTAGSKYGPQILFGTGPNDYAANVEGSYWTSTSEMDFNFYYGYGGFGGYPGAYFNNSTLYSTWAIESTPEPSNALMGLIAGGLVGGSLWVRRQTVRA